MKRKKLKYTLLILASIPLLMWLWWLFTPKKKMVLAIIDKSEIVSTGKQHTALTWVLNHEKYSKTRKKLYDVNSDYFGFFPEKKPEARIRGLEHFSPSQLEQLSIDADAACYVDTYGIYNTSGTESSGFGGGMIYGGLSAKDIDFLRKIKSRNKLIISEYNILEAPTPPAIRKQFEATFGLTSSGWTCRYFESFDPTVNKELPVWLVNNYKIKNGGNWPFTKAGLAFVNEFGDVVILEDLADLTNPLPIIKLSNHLDPSLKGLTDEVKFPFWFDIVVPDPSINTVAASYTIGLNNHGRDKLLQHNIPLNFPAVVMHKSRDYQFYYFSGNFCSTNTISISSSYFKGISIFKSFLYDEDNNLESTSFFWKFYKPLLTSILNDYYTQKKLSR